MAFVVRLTADRLGPAARRVALDQEVEPGERGGAVDGGLPRAEAIEVGSVEDEDARCRRTCHGAEKYTLIVTRRRQAAGSAAVGTRWRRAPVGRESAQRRADRPPWAAGSRDGRRYSAVPASAGSGRAAMHHSRPGW